MYQDKILGCILGGAVCDALGYPVEFLDYKTIQEYYTKQGIVDFPSIGGLISDDTQMTLFTIDGLLKISNGKYPFEEIDNIKRNIYDSYLDWFITQTYPFSQRKSYENYDEDSLLLNTHNLFDCRAPGQTCLYSLRSKQMGSRDNPINNSKGCGRIMRIAPIGAYFKPAYYNSTFISTLAGEIAATTHGHPLGYIPASMLALIINKLCYTNISIKEAISESLKEINNFYKDNEYLENFNTLINKSIELSINNTSDIENISRLGEGWIAEETLAIAIYCSLKYYNNFKKGIIASVNHNGDSDSTGLVTGNILGASLGYKHIPKKYINNLELRDLIIEMSKKLI